MTGPSGPASKKKMAPDESSGSWQPELRYLAIGRVVRAHGVRGELSVAVLTDFPERFETTDWVYIGDEYEAEAYRLEKYRWHKKNVLLTLAGITNRTQAEQLRGQLIQVPIEKAVPLPEGDYYLYQLTGLQIITIDGTVLGTVTNILETGANDVYVVDNGQRELLLPAIPDVVKSINLEKGQIVVELIDGLI
jgi:16S rRNA processing protein RimM